MLKFSIVVFIKITILTCGILTAGNFFIFFPSRRPLGKPMVSFVIKFQPWYFNLHYNEVCPIFVHEF